MACAGPPRAAFPIKQVGIPYPDALFLRCLRFRVGTTLEITGITISTGLGLWEKTSLLVPWRNHAVIYENGYLVKLDS